MGADLFKHYKTIVEFGRNKAPALNDWRKMKLFLIGGGSNLPSLRAALGQAPWPNYIPAPEMTGLRLPDGIKGSGGERDGDVIGRHERLLMVAFGLCFPFADMAERTPPREVVPPERPEPLAPAVDDTGKDGHWW